MLFIRAHIRILLISFLLLVSVIVKGECVPADFVEGSRPFIFFVNNTLVHEEDANWIADSLAPALRRLSGHGMVVARSAASPEGPYDNNRMLAQNRMAAVMTILEKSGIETERINSQVITEDYDMLCTLMHIAGDRESSVVSQMVADFGTDYAGLKVALQKYDDGRLWKRIHQEYYPQLRAVRIMLYDDFTGRYYSCADVLDSVMVVPMARALENQVQGLRPMVFEVNRTDLAKEDIEWIQDSLAPRLRRFTNGKVVTATAAASPEGPFWNNDRLAYGRKDAVIQKLQEFGVNTGMLSFDVIPEDYGGLLSAMFREHDPDYWAVDSLVNRPGITYPQLKSELSGYNDGKLWSRLQKQYYQDLRYVRFQVEDDTLPGLAVFKEKYELPARIEYESSLKPSLTVRNPRRELLAIKTNLLEWGAYVPQYGFCPMPNVELEYYPRHGHWTLGATFDCPWWIGNTTNHKYFELRNYQLYGRYYFRNSDRSYSNVLLAEPIAGQAAFRGFYLEGYAQAFLYQIGFSATKGWIGEGAGGGLGAGYTMPLSRDGHWRLDMGFQLGMFRTYYDPFVYGKPVYHGGEIDGNYYYDTDLYSDEFVKRMHRFTWLGPTRVGISISYDLLYRKRGSKKPSFSKWEIGGALP